MLYCGSTFELQGLFLTFGSFFPVSQSCPGHGHRSLGRRRMDDEDVGRCRIVCFFFLLLLFFFVQMSMLSAQTVALLIERIIRSGTISVNPCHLLFFSSLPVALSLFLALFFLAPLSVFTPPCWRRGRTGWAGRWCPWDMATDERKKKKKNRNNNSSY